MIEDKINELLAKLETFKLKCLTDNEDMSLSQEVSIRAAQIIAVMRREREEAVRTRDLIIIAQTRNGGFVSVPMHLMADHGEYRIEQWVNECDNVMAYRAVPKQNRPS